ERLYEARYGRYTHSAITRQMADRRRETMTPDPLADLVAYLRRARGERRGFITITNRWPLYGPNPSRAAPINDQAPTGPPGGRTTTGGRRGHPSAPRRAPASSRRDARPLLAWGRSAGASAVA